MMYERKAINIPVINSKSGLPMFLLGGFISQYEAMHFLATDHRNGL